MVPEACLCRHLRGGGPGTPRTVSMMCAAAAANDCKKLEAILAGAHVDPTAADYDLRTCLHVAAAEGATEAVRHEPRTPRSAWSWARYGSQSHPEDCVSVARCGCAVLTRNSCVGGLLPGGPLVRPQQ